MNPSLSTLIIAKLINASSACRKVLATRWIICPYETLMVFRRSSGNCHCADENYESNKNGSRCPRHRVGNYLTASVLI